MNQGFILLHRQFTKWEWYDCVNTKVLFLHLMLMANHQDGQWHGIPVKRGQHISGRIRLAKATGLSQQQVRTAEKNLKSTNEITTKSTNRYTLYTITEYNTYNDRDYKSTSKATKRITNDQQTINKQSTTNNNENNDNNDNNTITPPAKDAFSNESPEMILAKGMYYQLAKNNPMTKKPDYNKWAQEFDKMIRIDKYTPEAITDILLFAMKDNFWKSNILSPAKLRKQYVQLYGKWMEHTNGKDWKNR